MIYVAEAHPVDGWFLGTSVQLTQHKSEKERVVAAKMLTDTTGIKCNVVIDKISNAAAKLYGALIDRFYILQNGVVYYQGGPGPYEYDIKEMEMKLRKLF